jgi:hypothetical protein
MIAGVRTPGPVAGAVVSSGERQELERGGEFLKALETVSLGIRDPVAKLRFIRHSLRYYRRIDRCLGMVPFLPLRLWFYRRLSLEGLRHLLITNSLGAPVPTSLRVSLAMNRALTAASVLSVLGGASAIAYHLAVSPAPAPSAVLAAAPARLPVAEELPPLTDPAGTVWLVEKGVGYEQYSNGLRIDTQMTVRGEPRGYRLFAADGGMQDRVLEKPAGILFHTSESDIWPLEEGFNEHLRTSSHRLLLYVQRLRLYNYVIDRFGRIFRIVEEEDRANHAGHAIWERDGHYYLSLNNAFLGVCFETRWAGGFALPITQAQLAAGRNLTDYLRQRWEIPREMCVTHGLTSVNAKAHLIGQHLDWARGFPFEAFGLPDQYSRPAPSVTTFGFGYDDEFLKVLGEPWAGVRAAERTLADEAQRRGTTVDEVRRERQVLYDRWLSEQTRDEELRSSNRADRAPTRGPRGG